MVVDRKLVRTVAKCREGLMLVVPRPCSWLHSPVGSGRPWDCCVVVGCSFISRVVSGCRVIRLVVECLPNVHMRMVKICAKVLLIYTKLVEVIR